MYMWMEELIYLKDDSLKTQCLNNLSNIQKNKTGSKQIKTEPFAGTKKR
jgi:hypothetical protein